MVYLLSNHKLPIFTHIGLLALLFLFFTPTSAINAQNVFSGKIIDNQTGEAIAGANVYINNTTIGRISNADGTFSINDIPQGKYELVITYMGYETISYPFLSSQLPFKVDFRLRQKSNQLDEVVINGSYQVVTDAYNWDRFLTCFIGKTPFSDKCFIENKKDIELRIYTKKGAPPMLRAFAKKPIIIVNKALGYYIEYDLSHFQAVGINRYFTGKAFFRELKDKKTSKQLIELRKVAYHGSIVHFLRSVYANNIDAEGFEIRKINYNANKDRKRFMELMSDRNITYESRIDFINNKNSRLFGDSTAYIRQVLLQPEYSTDSSKLLRTEEIITINKNGNVAFNGRDSLLSVVYTKPLSKVISDFYKAFSSSKNGVIESTLMLPPNQEIIINPKINGVSNGLGAKGFFSSFYGISTMLPEDYEPTNQ